MESDIKVFVRSDDVVSCELEGGSALLDMRSSAYFRLNETANFIWEQLGGEGMAAEQLAERISQSFSVAQTDCLPDVVVMLTELEAANLITAKP